MMNPMDCRFHFGYKTLEPDDADALATTARTGSQCPAPTEKG
jgi:hypothetical protein